MFGTTFEPGGKFAPSFGVALIQFFNVRMKRRDTTVKPIKAHVQLALPNLQGPNPSSQISHLALELTHPCLKAIHASFQTVEPPIHSLKTCSYYRR